MLKDLTVESAIEEIGACGFECEAGPLRNSAAWQWLTERLVSQANSAVDHPTHYGGADNPYEAIKVIEAWELDFCLGNSVKYISRAGHKPLQPVRALEMTSGAEALAAAIQDLRKARWYLDRRIEQLENLNG